MDLFRFFRTENGSPALKWSLYIPNRITPTPKQALALSMCNARELLYGGAAGGGKSEFLLLSALQYVDMPAFSGIIIRKHLKDLQASDALLHRCMKWMAPYFNGVTDERTGRTYRVRYIPHIHSFEFDTYYFDGTPGPPSRLQFGYIGEGTAEDQHQGSAHQFVGVDEAGQHVLRDITWFYSRMRYSTDQICPIHGDDEADMQDDCKFCAVTKFTPIRMRLTANPGGVGHEWIKKRYDIRPLEDLRDGRIRDPDKAVQYRGFNADKPFIPSYWYDNRHTGKNYGKNSLDELIDLDRAQLRDGDWNASPDSRFQRTWARYYEIHRDCYQYIERDARGNALRKRSWDLKELFIFQTIDPAATAREGPGDPQIYRQGEPSSTVISTWGVTPNERFLFWLDCVIFSIEIPDVIAELQAAYLKWRPNEIICETNGPGIGVFQPARRLGLPMVPNFKVRDKVANATQAIIRMSQGRIFLPRHATWLDQVEGQVFSWFGHPHQADDIVDTLSDAARHLAEVTNIWYEREEVLATELSEIEEAMPMSFAPEDDDDYRLSDLII